MESFAYIHTAVRYEDPKPEPELKIPELKIFENGDLHLSNSALVGLAGAAVAASVLGGMPEKAMAATPVAHGSSGEAVEAIQAALGIEVDGQYGPKTEAAITDFQIRQGLEKIDGVVGQETAKSLGLDEEYRPVGFVETNSGIGLNIRRGPGVSHHIIGGAPDGAFLYQDYETVIYNGYDGYAWTPLETGGWVASDYTVEPYRPVSYDSCGRCGDSSYDNGYGRGGYYPVSYGDDGGVVTTRYRVGLNVRSGPGLGFVRVGGANEGSFVPTAGGVVYRDGYAWQQAEGGGWVATDYLY
jgi:uncharacterized protein YraI